MTSLTMERGGQRFVRCGEGIYSVYEVICYVPRPDQTGQTTGLVQTVTSAWTASAMTRRAAGVPRTRAHTAVGAAGTGAETVGGLARPRPPCSGAWACAACWPATRHRPPRTCWWPRRRRAIPIAMTGTVITSSTREIRCSVTAAADAVVVVVDAATSASVFRREISRHTPVKKNSNIQFNDMHVKYKL